MIKLHGAMPTAISKISTNDDLFCVYIASPYTIGNQADNVRRQHDAMNDLLNLGYFPIAPLLMHYQHIVYPRHYEDWMRMDLEFIKRFADILLRLDGESRGADEEEKFAIGCNIPVVKSLKELIQRFPIK